MRLITDDVNSPVPSLVDNINALTLIDAYDEEWEWLFGATPTPLRGVMVEVTPLHTRECLQKLLSLGAIPVRVIYQDGVPTRVQKLVKLK